MSKATKAGRYEHVTPAMVKQVDAVLAEAEKHKYSVSRVFGAFNTVMQKTDKPQTCSSCLRNRVRDLKKWRTEYAKATAPKAGKVVAMPLGENIDDAAPDTVDNGQDETADASTEDAPHGSTFEFIQPGHAELVADDQAEQSPAIDVPADVREVLEFIDQAEQTADASTEEGPLAGPAETAEEDTTAPAYPDQVEGTVRYSMAEGIPFDFLPDAGTLVKGTVLRADGSKIKAGTYATAEGLEIAVQVTGKATIKEVDLT